MNKSFIDKSRKSSVGKSFVESDRDMFEEIARDSVYPAVARCFMNHAGLAIILGMLIVIWIWTEA